MAADNPTQAVPQFRIHGRVTVKESGEAVRDIVVAVFDADTAQPQPDAEADAPEGMDRLGSVLTDADGRFELVVEPADFRRGDQETRPDLVVTVYAPEDSRAPGDPSPLPPQQRILHVSRVPRADAGRTEAYAIRLLRPQLERFGIRTGAADAEAPQRYTAAVARTWAAREAVAAELRPRVHAEAAKSHARHADAARRVARLSVSAANRPGDLYTDAPRALARAQRIAIERGLARLATRATGVTLRLTEDELEGLGLRLAGDEIEGEADASAVFAIVSERMGGTDLVRVRELVDGRVPPDELVPSLGSQVEPASPLMGGGSADAADPSADGATPEEAQQAVLARILEQLADVDDDEGARRPDAGDVRAAVDALELRGGPADETAHHDFHVLQLAFRHVWTEAFDSRLREAAGDLYDAAVRVAEETGVEGPSAEAIADVNALRDFISSVRGEAGALGALQPIPAAVRDLLPELTQEQWNALSLEQQQQVEQLAERARTGVGERTGTVVVRTPTGTGGGARGRRPGRIVVSAPEDPRTAAAAIVAQPEGVFGRVQQLILELDERLREPFAFDVFSPGSYNFGILVTYRQRWEPLTYQAGDLVATIPLAPGESRKFSKREVVRRSRAEKEAEKALSARAEEASQTLRAESEIMHKASTATNFKMTAEGSFNFGIADITSSHEFARDQAEESARNKRDFREATLRASAEYRRERSLEVESTNASELESSTSGEISNPNLELTVTYLLYELQRRYRVAEHVHRVRPVILVAQDVPAPHEIDDDWLLAHQWILRRVLLDDSLRPALESLSDGFAGSEASIELKRAHWEAQRAVVAKLEALVESQLGMRDALRETLVRSALAKELGEAAESTTAEDVGAFLVTGPVSLLFGSEDEREAERQEALRKAAETRLQYAEQALQDAQSRLREAADTFAQATQSYTKALDEQLNRRTAIDQLRVHVKQNVLHYMQAIWDHEPADQRFFRLYRTEVRCPRPDEACKVKAVKVRSIGTHPGDTRVTVRFRELCAPVIDSRTVELAEIADLDSPLGYKGNSIIFPLKEPCHLTTYMMSEFVDDYFGVRDPDPGGEHRLEDLLVHAQEVWHHEDTTDEQREALREEIIRRLSELRRSSDEIVVPSGQLFMEALPGRHPLLEDFKLRHRREDLHNARAQVRRGELENLRLASRLLAGEREDPDVDRRIVVDGADGVDVDTG